MSFPTRVPGRLAAVIATPDDRAATVLRVVLGLVLLPHALQKTFGLFGGYGVAGTMGYFAGQLHIPATFAALAIAAEFLGSLGLIAGLLGRVAAFGVACLLTVAALLQHRQNGLFMNWTGHQAGEGFEYHLLAVAIAVAVMMRGSGAFSLDRLLARGMYRALAGRRAAPSPVIVATVTTAYAGDCPVYASPGVQSAADVPRRVA